MADQASSSITIDARPEQVLEVISDLHAYPEWTGQIKSAEVVETYPDGRAKRAAFTMSSSGFTDEYVLDYTWTADGVSWTLVEPTKLQKSQQGSYALAPSDAGTDVTYLLTLESKIPMIGPMKRKANKMIIDAALKELKKRVEALSGSR
ncbi:MAG: cyclase/dehydrase [Frankiales bacterium]|nr:cyclase/dehydrase [Frankiales bacterium]